ncbi:MAG: hypothetical protein ACRDH8_12995 [Actinomycetota bacterium]
MVTTKELKVRYVGDASSVDKTLGAMDKAHATFESKMKSWGQSVSKVGKGLSIGLTAPLALFGKMAVDEFTEAQQAAGQTAAAIKSTGGAANVTGDHVASLADKIGDLSAEEGEVIQEGQNMLLTFTNIRNEVGAGNAIFDKASMAMANMAARMETDASSAAMQLGKALNDPSAGLSKLTRVGVDFTAALDPMSQEAQLLAQQFPNLADKIRTGNMTMEEAITLADEHGNVTLAQRIMLQELQKEFGGSAAAMGANASPATKMKLAMEDLAAGVGAFLVPALSKLAGWFSGIANWFQNLSPGAKQLIVTVLAIAAAIGPVLFIGGKLMTMFGAVSGAFRALSSLFMTNPFILLIAAVVALVVAIIANWDKVKDFLIGIWNTIKAVAEAIWGAIKAVIEGVWNGIKANAEFVWNAIKLVIVTPIQAAANVIRTVLDFIADIWSKAWNGIKAVVTTVWNAIESAIVKPLQSIWNWITGVISKIVDFWVNAWNGVKDFFVNLWDGIVAVFKGAINAIIGAIEWAINAFLAPFRWLSKAPIIGAVIPDIPVIHLPRLAEGGRFLRAGMAIVGERGAEVASFPRGAQVAPLDGAGGGRSINVIVNVQGSVIAERDLAETVQNQLLRKLRDNPRLGFR